MSDRINELLSEWLDDAEEQPTSGSNFATDTASEHVAESLLIHGLLADMGKRDEEQDRERIQSVMQRIDSEAKTDSATLAAPRRLQGRRRFAILTSALAIAAAALVIFVVFDPPSRVSAAMASLEKVVESALRPIDRTYVVHLVEEYPRDQRPRNMSQEKWDRVAPEQIDGATIYVRGVNEYVMKVLLKTGVKRTSGCDGRLSWSFREDGPVHVSTNLHRFRGGMPGNQQDMPMVNIHANLTQLKIAYDVELLEEQETTHDNIVLSQLSCVRKSTEIRGVKRVNVWFDAENGTVHKMLLDGLPRGRGGPKSVMLELIDQSELPPDFFSHDSHHEPGRRVKSE